MAVGLVNREREHILRGFFALVIVQCITDVIQHIMVEIYVLYMQSGMR